jgi:hypothetical protein
MSSDERSNERRGFLQGAALAAASFGLTQLASAAHAAEQSSAGTGAVATEFQRWLDSIPGKHRQVYDAAEPNGGFALITGYVFLLTGQQGYGVPESELGVVVVLRHNAIPIGFNDALWEKYRLGEVFKVNDPATKAPATRNPFANIKAGDLPRRQVRRLQHGDLALQPRRCAEDGHGPRDGAQGMGIWRAARRSGGAVRRARDQWRSGARMYLLLRGLGSLKPNRTADAKSAKGANQNRKGRRVSPAGHA